MELPPAKFYFKIIILIKLFMVFKIKIIYSKLVVVVKSNYSKLVVVIIFNYSKLVVAIIFKKERLYFNSISYSDFNYF